jgi:cell division protein FtsB
MYWFLLFLGVAVVWLVVLALLAKKLWAQTKALARELATAQTKLETAQRSEGEGPELRTGSRA